MHTHDWLDMHARFAGGARGRGRGFSLIEVLVVISILALLTGLVVVGATRLRENAKISQARAILGGLQGISADYEVTARMAVNHVGTSPIDWSIQKRRNVSGSTGEDFIAGGLSTEEDDTLPSSEKPRAEEANRLSEQFVWATHQVPDLRTALGRVGEGRLTDGDGDNFLEVRDPWGRSILYVSGNTTGGGSHIAFLPTRDTPFFASAGADGLWGSSPGDADAADNLYSFDIDR